MKKLIIFLLLSLSGLSILAANVAKTTVVFNVDLQKSNDAKVRKNIANEVGVFNVKSSLSEGTAVVTFDANKTNIAKLVSAFRKHGCNAVPMEVGCAGSKGGCLNAHPATYSTMK